MPLDERELRENSFFVSRTDTKEAICLRTPKNQRYIFPAFDLGLFKVNILTCDLDLRHLILVADKLQFPPNVGLVDWGWLTDWQLKNYTKESRLGNEIDCNLMINLWYYNILCAVIFRTKGMDCCWRSPFSISEAQLYWYAYHTLYHVAKIFIL